jgi:hypothetical protein
MPAKTVDDLIEFNKHVPDEYKVGIAFEDTSEQRLEVYFCFLTTGHQAYQRSDERIEYYELPVSYKWKVDQASRAGIERYEEPQSEKLLFPWGSAGCKKNRKFDQYTCHNAWVISVSEAVKGYGPLLYDCLLAKLGESGIGLIADRGLVSPQAANIWANYLTSRPEVIKKPLDLDGSTPETDDDCYASHHEDESWNTWIEDTEETKDKHATIRKAVNHAYFDNGIVTLDKLRKAGLVYKEKSLSLNSKPLYENIIFLQKLYKSILNG